jgi:hypothetical protein
MKPTSNSKPPLSVPRPPAHPPTVTDQSGARDRL